MRIPAPAATPFGQKRPAYVSPATKSALVIITPITVPSSTPLAAQLFPVTTPSPCSENPDGSKNCTFDVTVPFGNDSVVVQTYAVSNPGPNDVPLSTFTTTLDVAPGSAPPPVSFSLTGVVTSVALTIASPEPSISPQTRIMPAASPYPAAPLIVTPYDGSGNPILTDSFSTPISLSVTPSNAGVKLQIVNSQCSPAASATAATSISIACAKDLANVRYVYDGTVGYDASHEPLDAVTISASPNPTTASNSSIGVRLAGNVVEYPLPSSTVTSAFGASESVDGSNEVTYLLRNYPTSAFGRFNASNPNAAAQATIPYEASGLAVTNGGSIWIGQSYNGTSTLYALDCFNSVSSTPVETVNLRSSAGNQLTAAALTKDGAGNIWFVGSDSVTYYPYVGFIPASSADCNAPTTVTAAVAMNQTDSAVDIAPLPNGVIIDGYFDLYKATTGSGPAITPFAPAPAPSGNAINDLRTDGAGNALIATDYSGTQSLGYLPAGSTTISTLALPASASVAGVALFPADAAASRFTYADSRYGFLGVGDVSAFTTAHILSMANTNQCIGSFFDANGDAWAICDSATGGLSLHHAVRTSTWNLVAPNLYTGTLSGTAGIIERGDSSPFTLSANSDPADVSIVSDPAWSPFTHDIPFAVTGVGNGSAGLTVTDRHGRSVSAVTTLGTPPPCTQCAARTRYGGPRRRP